jgi:protoheme IX farnesyltransferase
MSAATSETQVPAVPLAVGVTAAESAAGWRAVYELTKPRITRLVTITAGVGFVLGAVHQSWETWDLVGRAVGCGVGTALSASGANALNQWWERERDARMPRTCARPLPTLRISPGAALGWGLAFSAAGVGLLALLGAAPALVSLATILIYVLVYTPLKPVTTLNTLVGAVPGALPPLIGWTAAATGNLALGSGSGLAALGQAGGWLLFLLMLVWQVPHFLAIAWMYKDDYAKGGYRMLPSADPDGRLTARTILIWAATLVPITLAPAMFLRDRLGVLSLAVALVSGGAFLWLCVRLVAQCERGRARAVFFASIAHLPLLLMAYVADAVLHVVWR